MRAHQGLFSYMEHLAAEIFFLVATHLVHAANELVDLLLTVTGITTLVVTNELLAEATSRAGELEGPHELVDLLEVGANNVKLVDNVLNAENTDGAESLLDDGVICQGETLGLNLGESTLVDELLDGLKVGVTVGDVRLNQVQHLHHGLGKLNKNGAVDLAETEELQDLLDLGADLVDTADTDNQGKLGLRLNKEGVVVLSGTAELNEGLLLGAVLLDVLLGTLEDDLAGGLSLLNIVENTE
jgi:hypothetical protein